MADADLQPCPFCREPVSCRALACPSCQRDLAVGVIVEGGSVPPRQRYELAKALACLGSPLPAAAEINRRLSERPGVLVRQADPRFAATVQSMLAEYGLDARVVQSSAVPGARRLRLGRHEVPLRTVALGLAVPACLALASLLLWRPTYTTQEIAARAQPAVVTVRCGDSTGSGVFVADHLVLTNAHVLCADRSIDVVLPSGGGTLRARRAKVDEDIDMATLEVEGAEVEPLPLGDATSLQPGDRLVMIGSPLGLSQTVHEAKVSRVGQSLFGVTYLQFDGNVNPGNSGGPVIDRRGRVMGIVTLKSGEAGIGLALPVNYAWRGGFVAGPRQRNYLGVQTRAASRFDDLVLQAEAERKEEAEEASRAFGRPGVIAAYAVRHQASPVLMVIVGHRSENPEWHTFRFEVRLGAEVVCRLEGRVVRWTRWADAGVEETADIRWLRRQGVLDNLLVGAVAVPVTSGCPGVGRELVMLGHDPANSRVALR